MWLLYAFGIPSKKKKGFYSILLNPVLFVIDARRFFYDTLGNKERLEIVENFFVKRDIEKVKEILDRYVKETRGCIKTRLQLVHYRRYIVSYKKASISRILRLKPYLFILQKSEYKKYLELDSKYYRKCRYEEALLERVVDYYLDSIYEYYKDKYLPSTLNRSEIASDFYNSAYTDYFFPWLRLYMWRKRKLLGYK